MPDEPNRLGDLLRELRTARNHTQETLSAAAGVSQETISSIERGETRSPRLATLRHIANVLGADVADFYLAMGMARSRSKATQIAEATGQYDIAERVDALPSLDDHPVMVRLRGWLAAQPERKRMEMLEMMDRAIRLASIDDARADESVRNDDPTEGSIIAKVG